MRISNRNFDFPALYTAGHALSTHEALALNTLREGLISKALVKRARKIQGESPELSDEMVEQLQGELGTLIAGFTFAAEPKASRAPTIKDPVLKEARKNAREHVAKVAAQKGMDLPKSAEMENLIDITLAKYPNILAEARRKHEALQEIFRQDLA